MQWVVDVSVAGDPAATKSFTFTADSWHKALLQARTALGDEGALGDFSIDLLKEGYRAVDPRTRRRFVIRATNADGTPQRSEPPPAAPAQAPGEDGPRTRSTSFMASVGTAAIVSSRPPPPVTAPLAPAAEPQPAPEAEKATRTQVMAAHGSSPQMPAAAPTPTAPEPAAPPAPPAPAAPKSVAPKAPPRPAQAPKPSKPSGKGSQRPPPPAPPPPQQYAATMLSRRDQEPSDSSPLTYREVSYALPIGTEEPEAEAFALQMLEELKREIPEDRAARFINIAVFDEIFTGKPTISPLVVLEWKDWKGPPVARYPRKFPSAMPNSLRSSVPGPAPSLAAALKEPSQVSRAPAAASALGDMFLGPATAPGKSAAGPATSIAAAAAAPLMPAASNPALAPQPVPSFGPALAAVAPSPASTPPAAPAPIEAQPADGSGKVKTQPLTIADLPAANGAPPKRLSGDELIADLFEEMHAMNFHEDAVAAGYFCLDLALSKIPAGGGLVHFYDVDKREYVVACARGPNAHALLLARHPDVDPFLGSAPRSRSAVIFQADGATPPRFAVFGGLKNLVVAPLWPRGRFMGAVEFINPQDGAPFTTDDANALTYIAEQLAEFIGSRGVVLDARRITRPPPADSASAAKARS